MIFFFSLISLRFSNPVLVIGAFHLLQKLELMSWLKDSFLYAWSVTLTNSDLVFFFISLFFYLLYSQRKTQSFPWFFIVFTLLGLTTGPVALGKSLFIMNPPSLSLISGLSLIHPIILFSSVGLALLFLTEISFKGSRKKNYDSKVLAGLIFKTSCTALVLGSWWAQQELNWGGLWSWDLVEGGALLISLLSLLALHFNIFALISLRQLSYLIWALVFFFIGLKHGFFNSVHAFTLEKGSLFKSYAGFYILGLFFFRNWQLKTRHLLSGFLFLLGFFTTLGLWLGFLSKYWNVVTNYQYKTWLYILVYVFVIINQKYQMHKIFAVFSPLFFCTLNWTWVTFTKNSTVHKFFFCSLVGLLFTKFEFTVTGLNYVILYEKFIVSSGFVQFFSESPNLFLEHMTSGIPGLTSSFFTKLDIHEVFKHKGFIYKNLVIFTSSNARTFIFVPALSCFFCFFLLNKSRNE